VLGVGPRLGIVGDLIAIMAVRITRASGSSPPACSSSRTQLLGLPAHLFPSLRTRRKGRGNVAHTRRRFFPDSAVRPLHQIPDLLRSIDAAFFARLFGVSPACGRPPCLDLARRSPILARRGGSLLPGKPMKAAAHPTICLGDPCESAIFLKDGERTPDQPQNLEIALPSRAQATGCELTLVSVAVDVQLQKVGRLVGRPARRPPTTFSEPQSPQLQPIHKGINLPGSDYSSPTSSSIPRRKHAVDTGTHPQTCPIRDLFRRRPH